MSQESYMDTCPACNDPLKGTECHCGYVLAKEQVEDAVAFDGSIIVPRCTYDGCALKVEDTTHFCRHLVKFNKVAEGRYIVHCDMMSKDRVSN